MARENVRLVEIPLDQGITTYGTNYQIGPRPRHIRNVVRAPSTARPGRLFLRAPVPSSAATATMAAADASHTNNYLVGIGHDYIKPITFGVFTVGGAAKLGSWNGLTGAAFHSASSGTYTAIATATATQRFPAAWAWWESQGKMYYSHAQCTASEIMQNGGTPAAYTTPAGRASALAVHLERLFIAQPTGGGFSGNSTIVKMTDANDPTTIRASRSFTVNDYVRAMLRLSAGDLDLAGQSHMLLGGIHSVSVFDGDPDAGNASYRVLSDTVGVEAQTLWVNTPYGVFALCTDGQLYRIPQGASTMEPVGSRIRDQFTGYNNIPNTTSPATLLWLAPYLILFPPTLITTATGFQYGTLIMDLTDPGTPEWTGPHQAPAATAIMGAAWVPETATTLSASYVAERTTSGLRTYALDMNASSLDGLTPVLRTGVLSEPGHDVILQRVVATVSGSTATGTVTCRMYGDRPADVRTVTRTTPAITSADWETRVKVSFASPQPIRGDGVWFELDGGVLHRVFAEVRVVPRQD